jgi:hypothetical protein
LVGTLFVQTPSEARCVRETFVALTQKLSGRPSADAQFRKYYEAGDPRGWKRVIDEIDARTGSRVSLGGSAANTHLVTLPGGVTVVTKEFPSSEIKDQVKILEQLEKWKADGEGPGVLGVSLLPGVRGSEKRLLVVMEDLFAEKNTLGERIMAGNGKQASLLRNEPEPARKWIMERMLTLLEKHPDPHPMNIIFRVSKRSPQAPLPKAGTYYQEGYKIYQAFLVDPSGAEGSPEHPLFNSEIDKTPAPLLQYNREWKKQFLKREMGLN